jgi:hypothetical protein
MMLMNPNKKVMQVLLGKLKAPSYVQKPGEEADSPQMVMEKIGSSPDYMMALEAAAQKLIGCVEGKNVKGCAEALKEAWLIMESAEQELEAEDEGDEG